MDTRMRHPLLALVLLYTVSAWVQAPSDPEETAGTPQWRLGPIAVGPPRVVSGDSPHYLVLVHTLIEDLDWDLSNNYRQAEQGDWDLGARFRGIRIDRHVDRDRAGRELSPHSPFFGLVLSLTAWPLRETGWLEPWCVLLTLAITLWGLYRFSEFTPGLPPAIGRYPWVLALGLATPVWCYARDLWTETWVMTLWILMLTSGSVFRISLFGFLGTLLKYPFAVVPITLGGIAFYRGNRRKGLAFLASGLLGLVSSVIWVQVLFRDVEHGSLFHSGLHASFDFPLDGAIGLLLSPQDGLLWFFPFLAWGMWEMRKGGERYLPALAFFAVYAAYEDWTGGTGFSARYLVPTLPVLVWALADSRPRGKLFTAALIYSLFWGALGGFFPALAYDRTPWGVFGHVLGKLQLWF